MPGAHLIGARRYAGELECARARDRRGVEAAVGDEDRGVHRAVDRAVDAHRPGLVEGDAARGAGLEQAEVELLDRAVTEDVVVQVVVVGKQHRLTPGNHQQRRIESRAALPHDRPRLRDLDPLPADRSEIDHQLVELADLDRRIGWRNEQHRAFDHTRRRRFAGLFLGGGDELRAANEDREDRAHGASRDVVVRVRPPGYRPPC